MSSSSCRPTLSSAALALSLFASVLGPSAAHASGPRLLAREVSGAYDMQDGTTIRIDVEGRRVLVESRVAEHWTSLNSNLLVSPDGLRSIRLLRDFNGTVDRIELQIRSTPLNETLGATRHASGAASPTEP